MDTIKNKAKVVVNADDFGISEKVTAEITALFYPKGIVTSTTIMANSNHLTRVKEIVDANPQISFGIHLNITEGPSLTKNEIFAKHHLIDINGNFVKNTCKNLEYLKCDYELLSAIYDEWKMQMDTLIAVGIKPDHIDGHHHCHTWYGLSKVAMRIANEYKVNFVRNITTHGISTMKDMIFATIASFLYRLRINFCNLRGKKYAANRIVRMFDAYQSRYVFSKLLLDNDIKTTDLFCEYDTYNVSVNKGKMNSVELMCHPGHPGCIQQTQRIKDDSYELHSSKENILSNYKF